MIEFDLKRPPEEAVRLIESKTNRPSYSWREVWKDAHQRSFTVAKAMESDILDDIRAMVEKAVKSGITLKQFQDELEPKLRAKGWWGRSVMVNPMTGMPESVTLGTPWRLKTIYRTNLQTAYQCGRYQRMTAPSEKIYRPLWQYLAVMDGRTRPSHAAMNGKIFKADDPIWGQGLYPPRGFNCRCTVRALTEKQIETAGLTERIADDGTIRYDFGKGKVEVGKDALLKTKNSIADDGWDYHPCEGWTPETETETEAKLPKPKEEAKPEPFKPAKTIKEAREWLVDNLGRSYEYPDTFYRYRHADSVKKQLAEKGFAIKMADIGLENINDLNALVHEANLMCEKIGVPKIRGLLIKESNRAAGSIGDGVVFVHKVYANKKVKNPVKTLWKPGDPLKDRPYLGEAFFETGMETLAQTFWHEIGHHIHMQKGADISSYRNPPKEGLLKNALKGRISEVSSTGYGTKDHLEWFAEHFSFYQMGRKDLLTPEALKIIEEVFL